MSSRARDAGFSLPELLVAMALTALVVGGALSMTFQSQARSSDRRGEAAARQLTRVALARLVSDVRLVGYRAGTIPPLDLAEPNRLRFVADLDDGDAAPPCTDESPITPRPEQVTYELERDGTLRRGVRCRNAGNTAWVRDIAWIDVAAGVDPGPGLFRYYDAAGNELGGGGALTGAQLEAVRGLRVGFDVAPDAPERIIGTGRVIRFGGQERIHLRNLVLADR